MILETIFLNVDFQITSSDDPNNGEAYGNSHIHNDSQSQMTVGKPSYEDELLCCGRNDTVAMDIQLIKGVLPDLFVVLKLLENDDDLVFYCLLLFHQTVTSF